jgi:hypothetical protein
VEHERHRHREAAADHQREDPLGPGGEVVGAGEREEGVDVALSPVEPRQEDERDGRGDGRDEPPDGVGRPEEEVDGDDQCHRPDGARAAEAGGHEVVDGAVREAEDDDAEEERRVPDRRGEHREERREGGDGRGGDPRRAEGDARERRQPGAQRHQSITHSKRTRP